VNKRDNIRRCKICKKDKLRRYDGFFTGTKDKCYRDEEELTWNGNTCGACHKEKAKNNMKRLRAERKKQCSLKA